MVTNDKHILKIKDYLDSYQYTYYPVIDRDFSSHNKSTSSEKRRCSLSRSCSLIKDYVLSNNFDYFFTLTIKDVKRADIDFASKLINDSIKKYSKRLKNKGIEFKYIYVFERQKKGGLHLHGYFSGFNDLYVNKFGHLSSLFFDSIGFQNFQDAKVCNPFYLIKYIIKEPLFELKHLFFRSRNLKKPKISYLHDNMNEFLNFSFTFQNQFCKMVTVKK